MEFEYFFDEDHERVDVIDDDLRKIEEEGKVKDFENRYQNGQYLLAIVGE